MNTLGGVEMTGDLQRRVAFRDVVRTISLALEVDERGKMNHASRVALLSYHVAATLGGEEAGAVYYAGLLHDLGAIGLADHVAHQLVEGVTADEVLAHPERGARIVRPLTALRPFEAVIRDHHERYDGTGFPARRRGHAISVGASVVHLADLVELSLRAAPSGEATSRIRAVIRRERGTGVPAHVADATLAVLFGTDPLIDVLADVDAVEAACAALCPAAPGVEAVTREELLSQLLWVLARVVDAKHAHTMGHSTRVAHLAYRIAGALGDSLNAWDVGWAGLLHDVGKIGVPRTLLDKAGPLDPAEWHVVRRHPADSEALILAIRDLSHLALPAASHHERYDGEGYPRGLAAEGIPLIGRVLAYADIYDALTSERAYRSPLPHGEALTHIRALVGSRLDPHLADAAIDALQRWGRSEPSGADGTPFARFFERDDADLDSAFGPESGSGTMLRPAPRRSTLASLEPWTRVEVSGTLDAIERGEEGLRKLTEAPAGARLTRHFDEASLHSLRIGSLRLREDQTFTQYAYTTSGKPLEVIVARPGPGAVLMCRSAEGREQSLERFALFYRNFLSSSEAVVFADAQARIVDVNEAFLRTFGYQASQVIGQSTRLLSSGRQDRAFYEAMWAALNDPTRGAWSGELVDRKSDGTEVDVRLSIESVRDASGACVGYLSRLVDITDRKRMEAELRRRQQELVRTNEEVQRISRFKDDLLAMTSHDLRGPLASIVNAVDLLRDDPSVRPEPRTTELLGFIRDTAGRLTDFVNDLLDLEKADSGRLRLQVCRVSVGALLAHAAERARAAAEKEVRLVVTPPTAECYVLADPQRLEQVLLNLLSNAVKFSPPGGVVQVRASRDVATLRFDVEDQGPGIPEHALEAIFDRFYQVKQGPSVTARGFGTGLGLSIVKNLVTLHGGAVRAENRAEGGCRFVVELPCSGDAALLHAPLAVVAAPNARAIQELRSGLEDVGIQGVSAETSSRLRWTCAVTDADLLLYEESLLDAASRDLVAELGAAPGALPLVVRLLREGERYPTTGERALTAPTLPSELRALAREATRRRTLRDDPDGIRPPGKG